MRGFKSLVLLQLVYITSCMDQLHIVYEWTQLDFQFPTLDDRHQAIGNGTFIPENNMPMGIEVYGDRMFITVPRWRNGMPASLTYINLKGTGREFNFLPTNRIAKTKGYNYEHRIQDMVIVTKILRRKKGN